MGTRGDNITEWRKWRDSQTDDDYRKIANGSTLERKAIYIPCGFGRSVLSQSPTIKRELGKLETDLREKGILMPLKEDAPSKKQTSGAVAKPNKDDKGKELIAKKDQRIKQLEERKVTLQNEVRDLRSENKSLKSDNAELKQQVAELKNQADYRKEHFLETGRAAR
jgi:FtsZ-binding cell division protein ZapB